MNWQKEIVSEYSINQDDLFKKCDDDRLFVIISKEMCFETGLAIMLGLTQYDIEQIKNDKTIKEDEKVIKMFWSWRKLKGQDATYLSLIKALYDVKNIEIMEKVIVYLKEVSQLTQTQSTIEDTHTSTQLHPQVCSGNNAAVKGAPYSNFVLTQHKESAIVLDRPTFQPFKPKRSISHSVNTSSSVNVQESYSRSASYPSYDPKSVGPKNLDNSSWQIFDKYYDELVNILCHNKDVSSKLVELSCQLFIIDLTSKDIIEQISCQDIKAKVITEHLSARVSKGRRHYHIFSKFVSVLRKVEDNIMVRDLLQKLVKEAQLAGIKLKNPNFKRATIQELSFHTSSSTFTGNDEYIATDSIKRYSSHIKSCYKKLKPDPKWSLNSASLKMYVDLAIIESGNHPCDDSFSKSTLRGTVDDITQQKKPLSFNELCNIPYESTILIEGAPGIGKSMLAYEMCSQWVSGESLTNYSLLLLLRLRESKIQQLKNVKDLLGCFLEEQSWKNDAVQNIIDCGGKGVIIILEGFDELPDRLAKNNSIFIKLVTALPSASFIFTSRPTAKHYLKQELSFSCHVEVIGFTKDSITRYVDNFFQHNKVKIDNFDEFLEKSPQVANCLYIPINLAIVCNIFHHQYISNEKATVVPLQGIVTSTKLYEDLVITLLYRHIKGRDLNETIQINGLNNLPHLIKHDFFNLCEMAYNGMRTKMTVFDVPVQESFETFDLMQKEVQVLPGRGDVLTYSFLHLTIQEFLAAVHITQMSLEDIQKHFDKYQNVQDLFNMLHFLAGLTKLGSISLKNDTDYYSLNRFKFLYEAGHDDLTKALFNQPDDQFKISRIFPKASPHDMYILGRCIALSSCKWELSFTLRGMLAEHIEEFKRGLSSFPLSSQKILDINFSLNQIGNDGLLQILHFPLNFLINLLSLRLVSTNLNHHCIDDFIKNIHKLRQIKKLLIHNNFFKEGEQLALLEAFADSKLQFEEVSFSKLNQQECLTLLTKTSLLSKISLYQLSPLSIEAVLQHMSNLLSLKTLCFHQSQCTPDILTPHLPQALAKCHQLQTIKFINCAIYSPSVPVIIEAILDAPHLISVSFADNYIDDSGAFIFCQMIRQLFIIPSANSHTLNELDVRHNPFTENGVGAFIEVLSQIDLSINFTLYLSLGWQDFVMNNKYYLPNAISHIQFQRNEETEQTKL